jgi:hypothetical protein
MYNPQDSINTAYNYIQGLRSSGKNYNGHPVYNVTKDDLLELMNIANKYGFPGEWLINLIGFETGKTYSPSITNSIGATGLIQFMPSTASGNCLKTTTDALRKMTFKQQLAYVDKYLYCNLKPHLKFGKVPDTFTQGDLFMTIFYPVAVNKPNFVFPDKVVRANSGISSPKDYVERALKVAVFPLSTFPYTLSEVKKKYGNITKIATPRNIWIAVAAIIVIVLAILLFIYRQKIATYITKL